MHSHVLGSSEINYTTSFHCIYIEFHENGMCDLVMGCHFVNRKVLHITNLHQNAQKKMLPQCLYSNDIDKPESH